MSPGAPPNGLRKNLVVTGDLTSTNEHAVVGVWVPCDRTRRRGVAGLPGRAGLRRSQPSAMPRPSVQKVTENLQGPGSGIG